MNISPKYLFFCFVLFCFLITPRFLIIIIAPEKSHIGRPLALSPHTFDRICYPTLNYGATTLGGS